MPIVFGLYRATRARWGWGNTFFFGMGGNVLLTALRIFWRFLSLYWRGL